MSRYMLRLEAKDVACRIRTEVAYVLTDEDCQALAKGYIAAELDLEQEQARADKAVEERQAYRQEVLAVERRAEQAEAERDRAVYLAQHLFQMVTPEQWRDSGGDDGQGHYEGEYHAEKIRDELAALAPPEEKQP